MNAKKSTLATVPVGAVTVESLQAVKDVIAKDATDAELQLFAMHCQRTGLDPFSNQIFCIVRGSGNYRKATFQTSIDGYRLVAERSGKYAGNDDPTFDDMYENGEAKYPRLARATVYKMVEGQRVPFSATARWEEYKQEFNGQLGSMWAKMPATMLGKCAEALALRKAFPNDLAGIYTKEEMDQSDNHSEPVAHAPAKIEPQSTVDASIAPQSWVDRMYELGKEHALSKKDVDAIAKKITGSKPMPFTMTKDEVKAVGDEIRRSAEDEEEPEATPESSDELVNKAMEIFGKESVEVKK